MELKVVHLSVSLRGGRKKEDGVPYCLLQEGGEGHWRGQIRSLRRGDKAEMN